jgi:hypothetical protein
LTAGTISGTTINASTIQGGIVSGATLHASGATIEGSTITGGTVSGITLYASGATLDAATINEGTSSGTTFSASIVLSPTVSGTVSAGSGLVIGGALDVLGFYGTSAVVQPSGIVIPSGGSTVDEVLVALSGVIVALTDLGLIGP